MKPTIGRIVHYKSYGSPGGEHKSEPKAAIITGVVNATAVHLAVLNPTGLFFNLDVTQGDGPGQWNWPPREEPQSAKPPNSKYFQSEDGTISGLMADVPLPTLTEGGGNDGRFLVTGMDEADVTFPCGKLARSVIDMFYQDILTRDLTPEERALEIEAFWKRMVDTRIALNEKRWDELTKAMKDCKPII